MNTKNELYTSPNAGADTRVRCHKIAFEHIFFHRIITVVRIRFFDR